MLLVHISLARAESAAGAPALAGNTVTITEDDLVRRATPEVLTRYAVENNPAILAAQFDWEAMKQRITSQKSYENPLVTYVPDTGDMTETRAGPQGNSIEIAQAIPFPGKLRLRGQVAESRASASRQLVDATIQEIGRQVQSRYADYYLATRALKINTETTELTHQFADVAKIKYQVGTAAQPDVILAREQLSRLAAEHVRLQSDRESAIGALNALLNRPPRAPLGPPADLTTKPLAISLSKLIETADEDRPELNSQHYVIEASHRAEQLARMGYLPDFRLSAQWIQVQGGTNPSFAKDGNDVKMIKFGFSVPIWFDRIGAEVRETEAQVRRDESRRRDLVNQVHDQVQRQYERVIAAVSTEQIYRTTLIPQTTERVAAAQAGYQTGAVDFLTVIDSLRSLEEMRLQRDRAVRDYQQALADLERAVGRPIAGFEPQEADASP